MHNEQKFISSYPFESLTPKIRSFANYIYQKNLSPKEMCATSVLAACTVATQGLIKVKFLTSFDVPVSLIFITEAESGERKTSNDQIAFETINNFVKHQLEVEKANFEKISTDTRKWTVKQKTLDKMFSQQIKKGQDTSLIEEIISEHDKEKPLPMKPPKMLASNITSQAIAVHLSQIYPFLGLISDEGGAVFKSGALSNPSMINEIWSNGNYGNMQVVRGNLEIKDASLSIHLQVQPNIFDDFIKKSGKSSFDSGNTSRWLYCRPVSTKGSRISKFVDIDEQARTNFNHRIDQILLNYIGKDLPQRKVKNLTTSAYDLLQWFSEAIEFAQLPHGHFSYMSGQASKASENVVRLAAVMHEFEDVSEDIGVSEIKSAIKLVSWHLNQYRSRFAPKSFEEICGDKLEDWFLKKANVWTKSNVVNGPYLRQFGPNSLREKGMENLKVALRNLESKGRIKTHGQFGSKWWVDMTPFFISEENLKTEINHSTLQGIPAYLLPKLKPTSSTRRLQQDELWPDVFLPD